MSPRVRSVLVLLVGGAALAFVADIVVRTPGFLVPRDFLEYWAAGRVQLHGGNPYDPRELLAEQQRAEPERTEAVMMWNPPPALAVYVPLGALPPRWAALLWVGLQLASVFVACDLLWRTYCNRARWLAAVVAISFAGTWWLVAYGQNTGFLLLGLAGFLHFRQKDKPYTAGAFAALTALKPHLLAVFGVLLVADAVTKRGAKALAAGVAVIALALVTALVANPQVVAQFLEAAHNPAPGARALSDWWLPVPAFWLRKWVAADQFWIQFVPCALACAAALVWRARAHQWEWPRALPLAVAVSVLATPYGGWVFDLPVLLVPVICAAAQLAPRALVLLIATQAALTAASFVLAGALHDYWWVAPLALAPCLFTKGHRGRTTVSTG
ncbi:MAG: DUF2029 domain-containing protein [Planctomycetes bacterium]|nr:DUF2029 domain-containing protein [Planctomycetota bacterium]